MADIYGFEANDLKGNPVSLDRYRGKVLLIVNVASKCGFTPQYAGLQKLYERLAPRGLEILGFPCNQFGWQEPGTSDEIQQFCSLNYAVSFPVFGKIDVNGGDAHPLFRYLKKEARGALGTETIKWNFTKFLVDREGRVVRRFAPADTPEAIASEVEALLGP
jgi:glutathione peroxidase